MKLFEKISAVFLLASIFGFRLAQAQNVTYSYSRGSGTYSQTATIGAFEPNNTEWDLTFNAFETAGGVRTLTSVTIETTLSTWGGSFSIQNLSSSPASPGIVQLGATAGLTSLDVGLHGITTSSGTIKAYTQGTSPTLSAYGQPGDTYTINGPPSSSPATYDTGVQNVRGSPFIQSYTDDNVGASTFGIQYTASGYNSYSGSNLHETITPFFASGSVTIVYNYLQPFQEDVPEPASVGLLVVGGLAMFLRHRFTKKP